MNLFVLVNVSFIVSINPVWYLNHQHNAWDWCVTLRTHSCWQALGIWTTTLLSWHDTIPRTVRIFDYSMCDEHVKTHSNDDLYRKEVYCSWFQPKNGSIDDQFPAMQINGKYWLLSLRIQKVIFRHIRLRTGFINRERIPNGRIKLRIPTPLLSEKKRTATRFTVCICACTIVLYWLYMSCVRILITVITEWVRLWEHVVIDQIPVQVHRV